MAAIQLKNIIKKVYGSTSSYSSYKKEQASEKTERAEGEQLIDDDPANLLDDGGREVLQGTLVDSMMQSS